MVLVGNEWQNKSEDAQKTTSNTTTTDGTTTATTSSSTTNTAASIVDSPESIPGKGAKFNKNNENKSETVAEGFINPITAPLILTSVTETATNIQNKTSANDDTNNEAINEIIKDNSSIEIVYKNKLNDVENSNEYKIAEVEKSFASLPNNLKKDNLEESVLNYNNSVKIMAENNKESPQKEDEEPQPQTLINNHYTGSNKDPAESDSHLSSNTDTLTTAQIIIKTPQHNRQQNIIIQQQQQHQLPQVPISCSLTPHSMSSALQSVLNANNNANNANISVAAAGLQPNFLSQLALSANVAGVQNSTSTPATILTANQLSQSFNMLDSNNQKKSDSNLLDGVTSTTSVPAVMYDNNGQAKIVLICESNSHPFQTRTISLTPNVECMVGRLIAKSKASENNAIFDCKVLSRKHAVIWYTPDGKFWVKDTKSSNGTFINENKLGDEEAELHFEDVVKFGVDVLENSRKEVHGCIIACVKLYLPDGREAISIDSSAHRSQYSGDGRISYDELHRLNLYIQETSQREKVLTSKLCNIQNILDATRKNSDLCWQSMITEDQLLHRIHSLEKKLQFMEKNVPENILRNEVLKLLDDKSSYQHTAKEALRKVYQERCDAMQMLAKMESAYTQSENECSVLRDQIMNSKQTLQDVNTRLLCLETEYNEYQDKVTRQQQREEQRIAERTEKLRERELECEDLKKKISELLIKRAELLDDDEQLLQKQAIEKLDAAIADMDLGDDDDSSDEDVNDKLDLEEKEIKRSNKDDAKVKNNDSDEDKFVIKTKRPTARPQLASIFGDILNSTDDEQEQDNSMLQKGEVLNTSTSNLPPKRIKETTIMKWLQNSDLNKNEGSFDIFKAICNENETEDEDLEECISLTEHESNDKSIEMTDSLSVNKTKLFCNFTTKLKNVQKNLQQLEDEIQNETKNNLCAKDQVHVKIEIEKLDDKSSDEDEVNVAEGACAEEEFIIKSNGKKGTPSENQVLSKENKKYLLLKSSVNMLREAYNEIWNSVREQGETQCDERSVQDDVKEKFLNIKVKPLNTKQIDHQQSSASDNTESDSEVESLSLSSPANSSYSSMTVIDVNIDPTNEHQLLKKLKDYQFQVNTLNKKLQQTELEAQHTLEIMQVECDDVKLKMENLNKTIEVLKNEKKSLEQIINENQNNSEALQKYPSPTIAAKVCKENNAQLEKDLELEDDAVLNAINVTALEREEELITYKERLDEQQRENIDLRNEIVLLKLKYNAGTTRDLVLKQYLPCSVIVLAIIIYFVTTYY